MKIHSSSKKSIIFFTVSFLFSFSFGLTFFNRFLNSFFWGRSLYVQLFFLFFIAFILTFIFYRCFNQSIFAENIGALFLAIFLWIPIIVFEFTWDSISTPRSLNNHHIQQSAFFPFQVSGIYGTTDTGDRVMLDFTKDGKSPIFVSNKVKAVTITYFCGPTQSDSEFFIDSRKVSLPLYCEKEGETTKTFNILPTVSFVLVSTLICISEFCVLFMISLLLINFLNNYCSRKRFASSFLLNWNNFFQPSVTNHDSEVLVGSQKLIIIIIGIISFGFIYQLNRVTPLVADDYVISFNNFTGERIQTLADVLSTYSKTYFLWSGRLFSLLLSYWMTTFEKNIFNIINSLFFVYLIFIIFFYSKHKSKSKTALIFKFVAIISLIWFFVPAFGETILWRAASPNYLWNLCFILSLMLPFKMEFEGICIIKKDHFSAILLFILGIIAGMAQENSSGSVIIYISAYVVFFYFMKKRKLWMFTGLMGCWLGYWILILAPGNQIRSENFMRLGFLSRLDMVLSRFMHDLFPLFLIFSLLLLIIELRQKPTFEYFIKTNVQILILFLCSVFSFSIMLFTNWYPERASFGSAIYIIIAISILLSRIIDTNTESRKIMLVFSSLLICLIFSYSAVYKDLSDSYNKWTNRIEVINEAKTTRNENVVVDIIRSTNPHNPIFNVTDLSESPDGWPNYFIARYYRINSISGK